MSDDIIVSVIIIKATPLTVFIQDKLVAVDNFPTNVHDDDIDGINEVKAYAVGQVPAPFSWSTKVSSLNATAVSLSSSKAS